MKSGATITKDKLPAFLRSLRQLERDQVLVGIPASAAGREVEDGEPINNALIGYLNENGSPAANIPARPHLRPGVASVKEAVVGRYRSAAKAAVDGDTSRIDAAHRVVGLIAETAVKRKITEGGFEPLAPSTLAARRRRGRTGEKPLLDTGQYRNAITHVIRPKG